jgi:sugar lactone lactonase YvrE
MRILLEGGTFYEGARWHEGAWYVSDIYAERVMRVAPSGAAETMVEVPQQPSGLGFMPDGSLLVVSMKDRRLLRHTAQGALVAHADLSAMVSNFCNDMVVDAVGRAYVGNLGFDLFNHGQPADTTLLRVDSDGVVKVAADGLRFPNGTVITADGRTLIVAESFRACLTAFTIDADGALGERRCHAELGIVPPWDSMVSMLQTDFIPDGCAIDAEDHVWVADAMGGRAVRVAPNGRVVETVQAPSGYGVYACALGGVKGNTLLLCAAPDFSDVKRKASREAVLYVTDVVVPRGAGLP